MDGDNESAGRIRRAAALFYQAYGETDGFGAAHAVVAAGDVSDLALDTCLAKGSLTPAEAVLIDCLRTMPDRDRLIAYHFSMMSVPLDERLPEATKMAEDDIARFGGVESDRGSGQGGTIDHHES